MKVTNSNPLSERTKIKPLYSLTTIPCGRWFGICTCGKRLISSCPISINSYKKMPYFKGKCVPSFGNQSLTEGLLFMKWWSDELERYERYACEFTSISGTARKGEYRLLWRSICTTSTYLLQFSLHLNMAEECMNIFERDKLPLVANVEQVRQVYFGPILTHIFN